MKLKVVLIVTLVLFLFSCGKDSENKFLIPVSTGAQGRVIVIMNKDKWEGVVGDTLRSVMQEEILGLPQPEAFFALTQLPHNAFTNVSKRERNLLIVSISEYKEKPVIKVQYDRWAAPQIVVTVEARNQDEFIDIFTKNGAKIRNYFLKAEQERLQKTYKQLSDKKIQKKLKEIYKLNMAVPKGFKLDVHKPHFAWISRETPKLSQAVFIWDYPYTDTAQFNINNLIYMRDSVTMHNVPGPVEGSFMTTEKRMPIEYKEMLLNGRYTVELRGLWRTEGAFLGGPFVSYTCVDTLRNRIVTVDGYVYAGKQLKRNYMRQVEAILTSLEFMPEAEKSEE